MPPPGRPSPRPSAPAGAAGGAQGVIGLRADQSGVAGGGRGRSAADQRPAGLAQWRPLAVQSGVVGARRPAPRAERSRDCAFPRCCSERVSRDGDALGARRARRRREELGAAVHGRLPAACPGP